MKMLLNELNTNPLASYKQSSKMLERVFGVKIAFTNDANKLREGTKKATAILEKLKYDNKAIDNREVSKYSLIKETLTYLVEYDNDIRLGELKRDYTNSSKYRHTIDSMANQVDILMDEGDSYDTAIDQVMKVYNSCKLRFPPIQIETDVARQVHINNGSELPDYHELTPATASAMSLLDDMDQDDILEAIEEMKSINEGLLTESDVDFERLHEIAEALLEYDFDAHKGLSLAAKDDEEDNQGVKVQFGKRKPLSPKDLAQVQRFKKKHAAQKNTFSEEEVDEDHRFDDHEVTEPTDTAKEFKAKARR